MKQLKLTINFIQQYSQERNSMLLIGSSVFYHHDRFEAKKRHLYHVLRTLVIQQKHRKALRLKYFSKNKPKIEKKIDILQALIIKSETAKAVNHFSMLLKGLNEVQAAIRIQKMWRGYVRRKLYKRLKKQRK
jgi:hypothetical protein